MGQTKTYVISEQARAPFRNQSDYCVGTGRMGLALQGEYMQQLAMVQEQIGFRYIRGHGLFTDDMAIYQEYTDEAGNTCAEYNFTYLDRVMDGYLSLGIKPFLELGFMPEKMASGDQTVFYWKGNVTPPKTYTAWNAMVQATLRHLMARYGTDEVLTWPIEVWNEPNLPGFWKDADMQEYFRLFEESFHAIKAVDARLRVGGPAICGVEDELWVREFLVFCQQRKLAIDFVTRHHYVSEFPERDGHYAYVKLHDPVTCMQPLQATREIVDSFAEFMGMEIHITEFNTSYVPNAPIHDTNYNAAYTASMLSRMGDMNESYSYWTFGDVFEELGVPYTPFHGGFGLVANGCIPKPTFWTFAFFKRLQGDCLHRTDDCIVVRTPDGKTVGVAWNLSDEDLHLSFTLPAATTGYCLLTRTVDEDCCNPLKVWHDLGEPAGLSKEQLKNLRDASAPLLATKRLENGAGFDLVLKPHAVVCFELEPVAIQSDRGYDYYRVIGQR